MASSLQNNRLVTHVWLQSVWQGSAAKAVPEVCNEEEATNTSDTYLNVNSMETSVQMHLSSVLPTAVGQNEKMHGKHTHRK